MHGVGHVCYHIVCTVYLYVLKMLLCRMMELQLVSPHNWKIGWCSVVFQASVQPWHSNLAAVGFLCLRFQNALSYA